MELPMSHRSPVAAGKAASALSLTLLLISGCATQDAVTKETEPLRMQGQALERASQSTAALASSAMDLGQANQARIDALARQLDILTRQLDASETAVKALREQQTSLADRLGLSERRVEAVAGSLGASQAANAEAAAKRAAESAQSTALAERMTQAELRLDELSTRMRDISAAVTPEYIRQHGKVAATLMLTEDKTLYPLNSPEMGAGDRAKLDELAARLKADKSDEYHLDIQGHTDNLGTDDYNYQLGLARAQVVKRYLHEQGGVPLSRMSVISYGAARAAGAYAQGNRRVEVNLLVLEK
jgi:outer membrane protein OmpA-like peptidoglycan-associated protein